MDDAARSGATATPFDPSGPLAGFRQLQLATWAGLLGQLLVWGSVLALWILGSLYSNIPASTNIAYGAKGISVSAGTLFALNSLLVLGAAVALLSLVLTSRSFQRLSKSRPRLDLGADAALTLVGSIGFGMFALGWSLWLGSFVPPGSSLSGDPIAYDPVLASNLSGLVDGLLFFGGLMAFLGALGVATGGSKIGATYEELAVEVGGGLSAVPVVSIVGAALSLVGLNRTERKLAEGWVPPVPPPPLVPVYPYAIHSPAYPGGAPILVPGRQGSWDAIAVVLVVSVVLLWTLVLPFAIILDSSTTKGPGNTPGGPGPSTAPSASGPSFGLVPVLLAAVATALLVPLAIVRNRRKRQRSTAPPSPPPPPPPPRPPPSAEDDPLGHLV